MSSQFGEYYFKNECDLDPHSQLFQLFQGCLPVEVDKIIVEVDKIITENTVRLRDLEMIHGVDAVQEAALKFESLADVDDYLRGINNKVIVGITEADNLLAEQTLARIASLPDSEAHFKGRFLNPTDSIVGPDGKITGVEPKS